MILRVNRTILSSFFLFVFGFILSPVNSQNIVVNDIAAEELFTARVKQFGEFSSRFNNTTDFTGNPADSAFRVRMPREKMLNILFDLKDPRVIAGSNTYSADYVKNREDFIKEITKKKFMLDKHSPGIIAEVKARVLYNGEPKKISIFLNQEKDNGGIKWVILSVNGIFNELFKTDTTLIRFIQPTSNETDFINLKRALEDKAYLHYYTYSEFKPDLLSMFLYCVNTGIIKYEYAEELVYHIISIPGWYFKVRDFNRNELNSGWLITDLSRANLQPENFR